MLGRKAGSAASAPESCPGPLPPGPVSGCVYVDVCGAGSTIGWGGARAIGCSCGTAAGCGPGAASLGMDIGSGCTAAASIDGVAATVAVSDETGGGGKLATVVAGLDSPVAMAGDSGVLVPADAADAMDCAVSTFAAGPLVSSDLGADWVCEGGSGSGTTFGGIGVS